MFLYLVTKKKRVTLPSSLISFGDLGSKADIEGTIAENPEERARRYLHYPKKQGTAEA